MKVIGIINKSELLRNYMISSTNCVVADPGSSNSQEGFSAFVCALRDLDKVATIRYVRKDGTNPKFVSLIPGYVPNGSPAAGADCLWHIQLPTSEDIRDYDFESLSKYTPNEENEAVAMEYVKQMTIVKGDAPETNGFNPEQTFNPFIARYWEALHARALEPDRPLPQISPFVAAMITPDPNVIKRTRKALRRFSKMYPLQRVVKRRDRMVGMVDTEGEAPGQLEQTDIKDRLAQFADADADDWFQDEPKALVDSVGTSNPVEDFHAMLKESLEGSRDRTEEAFQGIALVIRDLIGPQADPLFYDKAFKSLSAFREGALHCCGESTFNTFMADIKAGLLYLNDNHPFWKRMVDEHLTLISSKESSAVDVTPEAAANFLKTAADPTQQSTASGSQSFSQPRIFNDDLFDDME